MIPTPLKLKQEDFKFQARPNLQNKGRQTLIYEKSVWMMGNFWRQVPIQLPVTITLHSEVSRCNRLPNCPFFRKWASLSSNNPFT